MVLLLIGCNWKSNTSSIDLDPVTFKTEAATGEHPIIDVRTPEEYAQGHIAGAVNIDYFSKDFEAQFEKFDTQKKIYIYCRSGKRSLKSAALLKAIGFNDIYELEGGIINWRSQGLETVD